MLYAQNVNERYQSDLLFDSLSGRSLFSFLTVSLFQQTFGFLLLLFPLVVQHLFAQLPSFHLILKLILHI